MSLNKDKKICVWSIVAIILAVFPVAFTILPLIMYISYNYPYVDLSFLYFISPFIAILCGFVALRKIQKNPNLKGKKLANIAITIAGIIILSYFSPVNV